MEGLVVVGFAANTLQFINFTCDLLSSGRELYNNGALAENVKLEKITSALRDFNDKLKSSLKDKAPQSIAWAGQDKDLQNANEKCKQVAEELLQAIAKLQVHGKHRKWNSFRKALKTVWNKDKISSLRTQLGEYRDLLQLHQQTRTAASSEQHTTQLCSIEVRLQTLVQAVFQPRNVPGDFGPHNDCHGARMQTDIAAPGHQASSPIVPSSNLAPAIREDTQAILAAIQALEQRVMQQSEQNTQPPPTEVQKVQSLEPDETQGHTPSNNGCGLIKTLQDLKGLISEERSFFLEDARSIIKTLGKVLDTLDDSTAPEHGKRKRSESSEAVDTLPQHAIKRTRRIVASSQCVTVGRRGSSLPRLKATDYSRLTKSINTEVSHAAVKLTWKRRACKQLPNTKEQSLEPHTVVEFYSSVLEIMTKSSAGNYKIIATLEQLVELQGATSFWNTMTFSALISEDAAIWQCIENDDVPGMRSLFEEGKASVSDRDEDGKSLLARACKMASVDAVKFLVDHDLNVNEIAFDWGSWEHQILFAMMPWSYHKAPDNKRMQILRMLLRAGADPMEISENQSFESLVQDKNSVEVLKVMFEISGELVDINCKSSISISVLSEACDEHSQHSPDVLNLLLSRGADPLGPGNSGGTCLNTAVHALWKLQYFQDSNSEFFVILMRAIAKAQATKDQNKLASREELHGLHVLDNDEHTPLTRAKNLCIRQRKFFHAALVESGFDIDLFPREEICPVQSSSHRWRCHCYGNSLLDRSDQSSIGSGDEESEDEDLKNGVSADDACDGIVFEPGCTDGPWWLSNTDELTRSSLSAFQNNANYICDGTVFVPGSPDRYSWPSNIDELGCTYTASVAGLSDTLQARSSLSAVRTTANDVCDRTVFVPGGTDGSSWLSNIDELARWSLSAFQTTSDIQREELWDDQALHSPFGGSAASPFPFINTHTSTATGNLSSLVELPFLPEYGAFQATDWEVELPSLDLDTTTQPSATAKRGVWSEEYSFQASGTATEGIGPWGPWNSLPTDNALEENVWCAVTEVDSDADPLGHSPSRENPLNELTGNNPH